MSASIVIRKYTTLALFVFHALTAVPLVYSQDAKQAVKGEKSDAPPRKTGNFTIEGATKIEFKQVKDVKLHLHLFKPENWNPTDTRAGIVFFFGGGWVGGTPEQFAPQCQHLANRGMVAITAEYRVKSRNNVHAARRHARSIGHELPAASVEEEGHEARKDLSEVRDQEGRDHAANLVVAKHVPRAIVEAIHAINGQGTKDVSPEAEDHKPPDARGKATPERCEKRYANQWQQERGNEAKHGST